jgi:polyisoprenoid-binding protein YceI
MHRPSVRALPAFLGLVPALALTPARVALDMQPESRLWISGTSTVRSFECTATDFDAKIVSVPGAVTATLAGEKAVSAVEVQVPANKLDCKNGTMNEHMLKALKATANPNIVFKLASYDLARQDGAVRVALAGQLTLGGVQKPVTIVANANEGPTGALRVSGTHEIRMKEWGLKPPSLMMGTMKVDERIKVGFDLLLKD